MIMSRHFPEARHGRYGNGKTKRGDITAQIILNHISAPGITLRVFIRKKCRREAATPPMFFKIQSFFTRAPLEFSQSKRRQLKVMDAPGYSFTALSHKITV